jgi:two-component system, OmpR family, response regulator
MPDRTLKILVVDDDPLQLEMIERLLRLDGFEVATTAATIGVSNMVREFHPHLVLFDAHMPALSGDRLLTIVRRHASPETKLVLFSACDETKLRRLATEAHADGWISKSSASGDLGQRLRQLCG